MTVARRDGNAGFSGCSIRARVSCPVKRTQTAFRGYDFFSRSTNRGRVPAPKEAITRVTSDLGTSSRSTVSALTITIFPENGLGGAGKEDSQFIGAVLFHPKANLLGVTSLHHYRRTPRIILIKHDASNAPKHPVSRYSIEAHEADRRNQ